MNTSISISGAAGGVTISGALSRTGTAVEAHDVTLAAGKAGTLTTRTDENTGVVTSAGHAYTNASTVDVYWNGGKRVGMTMGLYDTNTMNLDAGTGDNFPSANTSVVVCTQQTINGVTFDGANACLFLMGSTQRSAVQFKDANAAVISTLEIANASEAYAWANGSASPINGTVASAVGSNGSTTNATLQFFVLTP